MAIILSALNPAQVASASSFEVLVGEPAQRLLIMSGIAVPEFRTNHDEEVAQAEIIVRLGQFVASLDEGAVTNLGLASIENDETNFLFRVDSGQLELEAASGELILRVQAAILGENTYLHRFSYQIVAHVRRQRAEISGVIGVPQELRDLRELSAAQLNAAFVISANRIDRVVVPGGFANDQFVPLVFGVTLALRQGPNGMQYVEYAIRGCPFGQPLYVAVALPGWDPQVVAGQVAGSRPVTLTGPQPDAAGVDFAVSRLAPVR